MRYEITENDGWHHIDTDFSMVSEVAEIIAVCLGVSGVKYEGRYRISFSIAPLFAKEQVYLHVVRVLDCLIQSGDGMWSESYELIKRAKYRNFNGFLALHQPSN